MFHSLTRTSQQIVMIPLLAIAIMGRMFALIPFQMLFTDTAQVSIKGLGKHIYDIDFHNSYTDVFKYCESLKNNVCSAHNG